MSMQKKKVLMVSSRTFDNGGVQAVMMDITRNCQDTCSFDVVLFTQKQGYHDNEFLSYGGKIFRIPRFYEKFSFLKKIDYYIRAGYMYKKIKNILIENGPYDAIHCHNEEEAAIGILAAKEVGVPIRISHIHTSRELKFDNFVARKYKQKYREIIDKNATHKIGCSQEACEKFFLNTKDAIVINNPYNSKRFNYDNYTQPEFSAPSLVQIGNFSHNKNQLFSLDVIAEIKKEYPNVHFNMIGENIHNILGEIKNKIAQLAIEENVSILPGNADSPKILSESTALLFPSKNEGFGIVAVEAQAMGIKCYVSDTVPMLTNCGGCEYLPLSAGAKYWADEIIEDFKCRGGKRQRYDCSRFSAEKVAQKYKNIYGGKNLIE